MAADILTISIVVMIYGDSVLARSGIEPNLFSMVRDTGQAIHSHLKNAKLDWPEDIYRNSWGEIDVKPGEGVKSSAKPTQVP